jgi:two-component system chemotaxis response regulator CheY
MTGFEILRYIRNNDRIKDTPLLLLTANTDKDDGISALSSAMSEYLVKPFSAEELEKKLLSLMPKRDTFGPQDDSTM